MDKDQIIMMLIKQNSELIKETSEFKNIVMEQQNTMMKVIENGSHNSINNNNPIESKIPCSNNKTVAISKLFLARAYLNASSIWAVALASKIPEGK